MSVGVRALTVVCGLVAVGLWIALGFLVSGFTHNHPSKWHDGACAYGECTTERRLCGCSGCAAYPCIDYSVEITTPGGVTAVVNGSIAAPDTTLDYACRQLPFTFPDATHIQCWWDQYDHTRVTRPPVDDSNGNYIMGITLVSAFAVMFTVVLLIGAYRWYTSPR